MYFYLFVFNGQFLHFRSSSNFLCCFNFRDIGSETGEEQDGLLLPRTQQSLQPSFLVHLTLLSNGSRY